MKHTLGHITSLLTGVAILGELAVEELVELGVEHTIGDELHETDDDKERRQSRDCCVVPNE